jgi:predicted RNase H-like HicB family nuclease
MVLKKVYPIILTPAEHGYVVHVTDLDIHTQGNDLADAIDMARDCIGLWGITEEDIGRSIPEPSPLLPKPARDNEIVSLVDIDFAAYRKAQDNRTVRKNLTIPGWLNVEAEKAGLNFSQVLQEALKEQLNIQEKRS